MKGQSGKASKLNKSPCLKNDSGSVQNSSDKLGGKSSESKTQSRDLSSGNKGPSKVVKKRQIKEITKTKIKAEISQNNVLQGRRRSSRLEKLDDNDPNRSKYTVDKLRHNEFKYQVIEQARIE